MSQVSSQAHMQGQHHSSAGQLQELAVCFLVYRMQNSVASSLQKEAPTGLCLLLTFLSVCKMMSHRAGAVKHNNKRLCILYDVSSHDVTLC
jgi:hypothetical protein